MVALLPCGDVDEIAEFWTALGLEVTYRQNRPYPYVALGRGGIDIHYYRMPDWDPAASHSTCVVTVPDTAPVHEAFAAGMRRLYGRLPVSGTPRMTRPRARANAEGLSGFSVVDPAGNWVRVSRRPEQASPAQQVETMPWRSAGGGRLARATENAVVLADSTGDVHQAHRVLASAVRKAGDDADVAELAAALAYLAELATRLEDTEGSAQARARLLELAERDDLSAQEREAVSRAVAEVEDLG